MPQLESVLVKPLITEKATKATEKSNCYGFVVAEWATKTQIKKAVEKLYDVKVLKVATVTLPGKHRRFGAHAYKSSFRKRALVQLGEGQRIEFFKGV
ncbi:MAG: 50S ribosomal protein L23 [Bdellovibrio sp.]|nr:50S ribosomal protein L23 [Bdellovibrio sp.]